MSKLSLQNYEQDSSSKIKTIVVLSSWFPFWLINSWLPELLPTAAAAQTALASGTFQSLYHISPFIVRR